jgi:murein tripeptide amidase MpaA
MTLIMNTTEIASALVYFEDTFGNLSRRIELPEKTCEGRTCYALRIAKDGNRDKLPVLIIGGVHAREWGGPDIVVNFAGDLLRAYSKGKGLKYEGKTFRADEIKTVIEERSVIVFPCVNPDGVEFSHKTTHLWRKNRNRAHAGKNPKTIGVDINRNYDFLWDFKKSFDPKACQDGDVGSDNPADETFHGPAPFSEPETRNVKWLMDHFSPSLFLDLHSYDGDVLYNWGDDEDQSFDLDQHFTNHAYDGKRGIGGDSYREYIEPTDYAVATGIASLVSDAMNAVRNRPYKPLQGYGLYPTSGTSDDYAFSRHIVNPRLGKTFGFTIEFNFDSQTKDPFLATASPKTLDKTMRDVIPGLITLCLEATKTRVFMPGGGSQELGSLIENAASRRGPFRDSTANRIWQLANAYDAVVSSADPGGKIARQGLLKAIQSIAARAAKTRPD